MPVPLLNDAKHWRERAEEARAVAESLKDPHARRMMLGIAQAYQKLAHRAEERVSNEAHAAIAPPLPRGSHSRVG
jgi:hypothetical protein